MRARRILVPALVVALAVVLWRWPSGDEGLPPVPGDVRACTEHLRAIYAGLLEYAQRTGHPPARAGGDFLEALFVEHVWEDTPENRARLTCPGTGTRYAARDAAAWPLARLPSGGAELEPLAACDGSHRLPHEEGVNVLLSDGSVEMVVLAQEIESGRLPAGAKALPVGRDSPVPWLQKLASD